MAEAEAIGWRAQPCLKPPIELFEASDQNLGGAVKHYSETS